MRRSMERNDRSLMNRGFRLCPPICGEALLGFALMARDEALPGLCPPMCGEACLTVAVYSNFGGSASKILMCHRRKGRAFPHTGRQAAFSGRQAAQFRHVASFQKLIPDDQKSIPCELFSIPDRRFLILNVRIYLPVSVTNGKEARKKRRVGKFRRCFSRVKLSLRSCRLGSLRSRRSARSNSHVLCSSVVS